MHPTPPCRLRDSVLRSKWQRPDVSTAFRLPLKTSIQRCTACSLIPTYRIGLNETCCSTQWKRVSTLWHRFIPCSVHSFMSIVLMEGTDCLCIYLCSAMCEKKGWMGLEVDQFRWSQLCWASHCLCCCGGDLFLRILCCNLLVKKEVCFLILVAAKLLMHEKNSCCVLRHDPDLIGI